VLLQRCESGQIGLERPLRSWDTGKTVSLGDGAAASVPRSIQHDTPQPHASGKAHTDQTKKCCPDLDHQAHRRADIAKT
jgi:hypothetical protein